MKKPNSDANEKKNNSEETLKIDTFQILRANVVGSKDTVFFDMKVNGIIIYGCVVVEGSKGDFISLPQRAGNDGKYYSIVWARFSDEDQAAIIKEVENLLG